MSETKVGVVKWFSEGKGYGFAELTQSDGTSQDVFIHYTAIVGEGFKTLAEGETVCFDLVPGPKGSSALNVKRLSA